MGMNLIKLGCMTSIDPWIPLNLPDTGTTAPTTSVPVCSIEYSATYGIAKTRDGDISTFWSTPARVEVTQEWAGYDLGSSTTVTTFNFYSRYKEFVPKNFNVYVSNTWGVWGNPALEVRGYTSVGYEWGPEWSLSSNNTGRYVLLYSFEPARQYYNGTWYTQLMEVSINGDRDSAT